MSRRPQLERLRDAAPAVLPSLLMCDFGNLEREVAQLEAADVAGLHLDVMDGRFVPNLSYGMPVVEAFRRLTDLPLDVHLMIEEPRRYLEAFVESGADVITIHIEATDDAARDLAQIRELGACGGLALNPNTPLSAVTPHLELCDLVLVMSVNTGFGGQQFNPIALQKLKELKELKEQSRDDLMLEIDGGVNSATIGSCAEAGADLLVVGSAIFQHPNYGTSVRDLETLAQVH